MKKILLLEDKIERDSLKQCTVEFGNFDILKTSLGEDACNELNKFINNNDIFNTYETILVHGSITCGEQNIISTLKTYCNDNNKKLVIFSGGDDIASLQNNILEITAKSFYENIEVFLKHYTDNSHILMLAYGEKWTLNILLSLLEKINIFIENKSSGYVEDFDDFEDDFDLLKIKAILSNIEYKNIFNDIDLDCDEISIPEIIVMSNNIKKLIQDKI